MLLPRRDFKRCPWKPYQLADRQFSKQITFYKAWIREVFNFFKREYSFLTSLLASKSFCSSSPLSLLPPPTSLQAWKWSPLSSSSALNHHFSWASSQVTWPPSRTSAPPALSWSRPSATQAAFSLQHNCHCSSDGDGDVDDDATDEDFLVRYNSISMELYEWGSCLRFHYLNVVFGRFVPRVGFSKSTVVLLWVFCLLHKSFVTIITAIVIEVIKISAFWHLNGWRGYKYKTKNKYKYHHKYIYQYKDKYRYLWLPNGPASWLAACLQLAQLAAAAPPGYVTTTQGLRQI